MQVDVNDENLYTWAYDYLNLKGSGVLIVSQTGGGSISATFTNDGKLINETFTPLDFSSVTEDKGNLEVDGYFWNHATKTLTLQNIILHESLIFRLPTLTSTQVSRLTYVYIVKLYLVHDASTNIPIVFSQHFLMIYDLFFRSL